MFVGRSQELSVLEEAYATGTFQMVVVYGKVDASPQVC